MQHFCTHIDWLSVHGVGRPSPRIFSNFRVDDTGLSTKNYKNVYNIVRLSDNAKCAVLLCNPFSAIIHKNSVHLKLENVELWRNTNFVQLVQDIFADLSLTYIGLSRVDFCCDFDEFANCLKPHNFIERFLRSEYRKFGRTHYCLHGDQLGTGHKFSYLSFGKRSSGVMVYLYNKKLELEQVRDKPYIREACQAAGIDTTRDWWRLEISVNTNLLRIINNEQNEPHKIEIGDFENEFIIKNLFFALCYKYFRFHINQQKRDIKDNPLLWLFSREFYNGNNKVIVSPIPEQESDRTTKIFIKKMLLLEQELYALDATERANINGVIDSLQGRFAKTFFKVADRVESERLKKDYTTKR